MLQFYELAPSPNNTKIRMALRYKGIPFEAIAVDPKDRALPIEVSGQEGTPVIADKGIVLPESEAILHYLDANYPDTPRLFPRDKAGRAACDEWRRTIEERMLKPWAATFFYALGFRKELDAASPGAYRDALAWLEGEVAGKEHIHGEERPICDLRVAQWASFALPGEGLLARMPYLAKMRDAIGANPADYPALVRFIAPWNERLA